jgi:hypothetical protein
VAPCPHGRPLLPIQGVVSLIDENKDRVIQLVEEGQLLWAWNLALDCEDGRKKMLRILPSAVEDFLAGRECLLEWADVEALLFPEGVEPLRAVEAYSRLNIHESLLYSFINRGEVKAVSSWRPGGLLGSARLDRGSVVSWLKSRRWPFPEPD